MNKLAWLLSTLLILASCKVGPKEINYGEDACHFCKMTIVDAQHASELVTVKGKVFKYDAIECMMNHLAKWDEVDLEYYLVADYSKPKVLVDATKAHFLVSKAVPSPMGEYLSAFEDKGQRDELHKEKDGEKLSWSELQKRFEVN
ncbi:MAG: nitrous oxide reductase accessory protein NosL [Cyclobacteriaceae bacterium]